MLAGTVEAVEIRVDSARKSMTGSARPASRNNNKLHTLNQTFSNQCLICEISYVHSPTRHFKFLDCHCQYLYPACHSNRHFSSCLRKPATRKVRDFSLLSCVAKQSPPFQTCDLRDTSDIPWSRSVNAFFDDNTDDSR